MYNQAYIFFVFILNGFIIGILFDIFRILRKSFKTSNLITSIQDIFFWILTLFILLYSIFKFNNGELRLFIFIGIFIGVLLYMLIFSNLFIKINVFIINIFKKIFNYIIIIPIKFIINIVKKLFFKPISFVCINFKKFLSNFKINSLKLHKKIKKT